MGLGFWVHRIMIGVRFTVILMTSSSDPTNPYLLRLHVKRRSAKTRQSVLTSLYCSVYIVWKSFTSSRGVGEHPMCRLVNKGLYGVGKHAYWLQISRIWQLLFMPVMKLVPWTVDRAAHCKIHPLQTRTDVTACVHVTCAKSQAYKFYTGFVSPMLKNKLEITA